MLFKEIRLDIKHHTDVHCCSLRFNAFRAHSHETLYKLTNSQLIKLFIYLFSILTSLFFKFICIWSFYFVLYSILIINISYSQISNIYNQDQPLNVLDRPPNIAKFASPQPRLAPNDEELTTYRQNEPPTTKLGHPISRPRSTTPCPIFTMATTKWGTVLWLSITPH